MKKLINTNECSGFISAQMKSANSITFCGELPKTMKAERIRLVGEIEVNGTKLNNPILEDIDGVVVTYHKESADGAIATAYFLEGLPEKLLAAVQNYVLTDFEVLCAEVCPCCGC